MLSSSPTPVPSECLPRTEKMQTSNGFNYRLFFACGPHAVHMGTGEPEDKPSYLLPSSQACSQFLNSSQDLPPSVSSNI